ncbi:hypothetical protein T06_15926 [Trichinella sp. T6]|nr:hypothetical protein T06_15926 [Trichinella sp. T6]
MDFRKYFPTAEFLAEFVQKIIRLVYVVETLMLFQERYVITIVCRGVAQLILDNEMIRTDKFCSDKMQLHQQDGDVCDRWGVPNLGLPPLGLNYIRIRAHCSFIGRCPRYFIIGR